MNWAKRVMPGSKSEREAASKPAGKVNAVDLNPLNWLYITYNTAEELVRFDQAGKMQPAAMESYRWLNSRTIEIKVRRNERFPDGEELTSASVKQAFDEMMRWRAPHPPGTHFNLDSETKLEITGSDTVRIILPKPDGLALGKLRAMHIMSSGFWNDPGFGYKRRGSGEGVW